MTGLRAAAHSLRKRLAPARGVTLIELLVVLAILVTVLAGMTTLFLSATTSQIDQTNRVRAQQEARLALDGLRREIHCASAISPDLIPTGGVALITLTLGPYCQNASTKLTSALTIPATGIYTVSGADTSPFATAGKIYVGEASGAITCTGKTATSFTGCTGGTAGNYAGDSAVTAITSITWCTREVVLTPPAAIGSRRYTLWRYRGSACSGTGRQLADYITEKEATALPAVAAGKVFTGYTAAVAGELRALTIALPVDVTPADTTQRYILRDDVVLRNSPRS